MQMQQTLKKISYTAGLQLKGGFFSKNERKTGVLLEDDPKLYYTAEIKDKNQVHPFVAESASEWFSIDLRTIEIKSSKNKAEFSLQDMKDGSTKATFCTESIATASAWVSMINIAKEEAMLGQKLKQVNLDSTNAGSSQEISEIEQTVAEHIMFSDPDLETQSSVTDWQILKYDGQQLLFGQNLSQDELKENLLEMARNFKPFNRTDDYRSTKAAKEGGIALDNQVLLQKYRNAFKDLIGQVGKMILAGNFELYKVSFPIKAMSPTSILKMVANSSIHSPTYLTAAAFSKDPVERMKFVICNSFSFHEAVHTFEKPLNPVLGETYQAQLPDGGKIYVEQISHHPPISYVMNCGPNEIYRWYGPTSLSPKASFNSISLTVIGNKTVEFADGTKIVHTPVQDIFQNTLFGTLVHQLTGRCEFSDKQNGLFAFFEIKSIEKNQPKDYIEGQIELNGKVICKISGNYLGYLDFNGQRYWDLREDINFFPQKEQRTLPSDSTKRIDAVAFRMDRVEQAQVNKDKIEEVQRHDKKLREEAQQRRNKGGAKIIYDYTLFK